MPTHEYNSRKNPTHIISETTREETDISSINMQSSSSPNYNTSEYRAYIGFLAASITVAALFFVIAAVLLLLNYVRKPSQQRRVNRKKVVAQANQHMSGCTTFRSRRVLCFHRIGFEPWTLRRTRELCEVSLPPNWAKFLSYISVWISFC
ncbi:hypothetical protein BKA66DRAFT_444365 [Pyrenochaeta sp. MPI-SDFR-AT-0127]|nr:hypothetical protein BKA66DRAFT_444365 [Pyrenochaeta sp. MPI-SDFR-AT-0127]